MSFVIPTVSAIATRASLRMIRVYQRWISPYKGYRCPHRLLHEGASCSQHIATVIRTHGAGRHALHLAQERFEACGQAAQVLATQDLMASTDGDESGISSWEKCSRDVPVECTPSYCCMQAVCGECSQ